MSIIKLLLSEWPITKLAPVTMPCYIVLNITITITINMLKLLGPSTAILCHERILPILTACFSPNQTRKPGEFRWPLNILASVWVDTE